MAIKLYLEQYKDSQINEEPNGTAIITLESFICLFLLDYIEHPEHIIVHLVESTDKSDAKNGLQINTTAMKYVTLTNEDFHKEIASNCNFPVVATDSNVVIAGLCGVCRCLVKNSDECFGYLLGFKGACLLSPSEASIWTKYCEVDIVQCTKDMLRWRSIEATATPNHTIDIPEELVRFESHMAKPIRMHNVYKLARNIEKEKLKQTRLNAELSELSLTDNSNSINNDRALLQAKTTKIPRKLTKIEKIASGTPIDSLNIDHKYVEGTEMSIADILLYPHFWIHRKILTSLATDPQAISTFLPLTYKWLSSVESAGDEQLLKCMATYGINRNFPASIGRDLFTILCTNVQQYSLYKSDPKRYKPKNRIFTKQKDIESSLDKVNRLNLEIASNNHETVRANAELNESDFGWSDMPFEVQPDAVDVPEKRLLRKKHQLESLAKQIMRIADDGDRIVDFCSGTGHLGILLAYKLPKCRIVLLENKETSLTRAKQRVDQLQLSNVEFFQCNLDYFRGPFNIGASLHACGVATDIVLKHCLDRRANFVCCACCYGKCLEMPHISYPRCELFRANGITNQEYMHLAHGADQSHVDDGKNNLEKCKQGQYCMDIVDTDRKLYAEECGYRVMLCRLYPDNCTPKNRLLVGVL